MAIDVVKRMKAFERTSGHCHICGEPMAFRNYAAVGRRGAWEIEHSKPRARGGTDHGNNLYAAHIPCNRAKQARSTKSARAAWGRTAAPLSDARREKIRDKNTLRGILVGTATAAALGLAAPAVALAAITGGLYGESIEPDKQRVRKRRR
jgi:hypothetical protein